MSDERKKFRTPKQVEYPRTPANFPDYIDMEGFYGLVDTVCQSGRNFQLVPPPRYVLADTGGRFGFGMSYKENQIFVLTPDGVMVLANEDGTVVCEVHYRNFYKKWTSGHYADIVKDQKTTPEEVPTAVLPMATPAKKPVEERKTSPVPPAAVPVATPAKKAVRKVYNDDGSVTTQVFINGKLKEETTEYF